MKNCQEGTGLLPGDSHASPTASPEKSWPPKTSAIYGLNVGECFASYDRESRSLKMSLGSLFPMEAGFLQEFCGTLPKAGMMRSGRLYPLRTRERRTCENESGLSVTKNAYVQRFPTPDVRGFTNDGSLKLLADAIGDKDEFMGMAYRANRKKKESLWPTPRAGNPGSRPNGKGGAVLAEEVRKRPPYSTGQLNPDWVEALMGYPHGWTDPDQETAMEAGFPGAWADGTWEEGIPRVASGVKNRVRRLKCLGNAIVPQCAEMIFRLPAFDQWRRADGHA
jgi:hypothetical protein